MVETVRRPTGPPAWYVASPARAGPRPRAPTPLRDAPEGPWRSAAPGAAGGAMPGRVREGGAGACGRAGGGHP